ncbi:hypothetical protein E1301_Tti014832 [Triplophysa tibetana]|uniref:Uncharacterized protein n=1 Tax=Triplophysa tibetana TaxID=1572043 RepID=A0A5A9PVN6_9TELE|nr:hypothetical protein E1301_Tti014832 [Triplophysa tibetana]
MNLDVLADIRSRARRMVSFFRSSTKATEKLIVAQERMARQPLKLLHKVEARCNSTHDMLQRLVYLREPVDAALASLSSDIMPPSSADFDTIFERMDLQQGLNKQCSNVESIRVLAMATLLDSRFKTLGFGKQNHVREAERLLTGESGQSGNIPHKQKHQHLRHLHLRINHRHRTCGRFWIAGTANTITNASAAASSGGNQATFDSVWFEYDAAGRSALVS